MYATLADLVDRAGDSEILQVADRDLDGVADASVITAALQAADDTINAYLAPRYALPLSVVPAIVVKWAVSLARYTLHRDGAPDHVADDQKTALGELRDASSGRLGLPDVAGLSPTAAPGAVTWTSGSSAFDRDHLEGWL
mgnify:CR=1 FL=1